MVVTQASIIQHKTAAKLLPVNDVGQEVVVFQSVVDVNFLIVDSESARLNAPLLKDKMYPDVIYMYPFMQGEATREEIQSDTKLSHQNDEGLFFLLNKKLRLADYFAKVRIAIQF